MKARNLLCITGLVFVLSGGNSLDAQTGVAEVDFSVDAESQRFRYTLRSLRDQELVNDPRLIRLRVRVNGERRYRTCRHPDAPRRVDERRLVTARAGETFSGELDFHMLCWGRATQVLSRGGTIELSYGFRRRARHRYIARHPSDRRAPHRASGAQIVSLDPRADESGEEQDVRVRLRPTSTRRRQPLFRVSVSGNGRAYLRDDLLSFDVRTPSGEVVHCAPYRQAISPIRDFYRRIRRAWRTTVASEFYCPEETFENPGIYRVTPSILLPYDGDQFRIEAITGKYVGEPSIVRIVGP